MRIPPLAKSIFKLVAVLATVAVAVLTAESTKNEYGLTPNDKAYYADASTINFIRPGLVMKITGAEVATDGTIKTTLSITDPKGVGLDRLGITTPGPVSISCVAAVLPKNDNEFTAYTTRVQTSTITGASATQASTDSGGTWTAVSDGVYTYTFKTKAPSGYDRSALHRVACQASRDLTTEFDMPTNRTDAWFDFVPDGSATTQAHDVVSTAACNQCHGKLAFHGGARQSVQYCVTCHTKQSWDPDTGNTVDFPVMVA